MARRDNITGIPKLSIGTTKNDRGYVMNRYCFNFKDDDGKPCSTSFYFGKTTNQIDAYFDACEFMKETGENLGSKAMLKQIFIDYKHEELV